MVLRRKAGTIMKSVGAGYSPYDIPGLEETEFALAITPCPRIEDFNDLGEIGDAFSIGLSPLADDWDV
jgi:hypothetical protein